ncbi:three-Cys-motif partner protein [Kineothrix alysoides]|uniref:Three-Cys-motif partner protein n=1 Tax=Kineothrix alysoides TaxID=1469948 RepID=A0A4R1R572_9FIRM|nr:three-Cys-motif partner protein TcmP [Kineothrix alysoides]TCL60588.1 three-Cys-motif partner protein [Kineothrix alysoides]
MKDYEKCADHTIKKFELVSTYIEGWARKILGYGESKGLVYIDCMCNRGKYYSGKNELIEGTAIRVAKSINEINSYFKKEAILYFNDLDNEKIQCLQTAIEQLDLNNVTIFYSNEDANDLLRTFAEKDFLKHNTLVFYDPYEADIDWVALSPFFNIWGEVIINHMVSDPIRGAKTVKKSEKIAKYEKTYHHSIDEIIAVSEKSNNREELEKMITTIIDSCIYSGNKKYYIASFPFYIQTNQLMYNLIFFSWNKKGTILFKKIAWDTFDGQSAVKRTTASIMKGQYCLDFDTGNIKQESKNGVYTIYDIAKYVYDKYQGRGEVQLKEIYAHLENHPIFPSDGYKMQIRNELKETFGVKFTKNSVVL